MPGGPSREGRPVARRKTPRGAKVALSAEECPQVAVMAAVRRRHNEKRRIRTGKTYPEWAGPSHYCTDRCLPHVCSPQCGGWRDGF